MSSPFWLAVELSRFLSSFGTRRTQSVWYIGWHFVRLVSRWWIESRVCEEGEKKPHVSTREKKRRHSYLGRLNRGAIYENCRAESECSPLCPLIRHK
jgi:hypothetical protein